MKKENNNFMSDMLCFGNNNMLSLLGCNASMQDVSSKNDSLESQNSEPTDDNTKSNESKTHSPFHGGKTPIQ